MIEFDECDVADVEAVRDLGIRIGKSLCAQLAEAIYAMPMESRLVFLAALASAPIGQACAAIGWEALHSILDTCKLLSQQLGDEKKAH